MTNKEFLSYNFIIIGSALIMTDNNFETQDNI